MLFNCIIFIYDPNIIHFQEYLFPNTDSVRQIRYTRHKICAEMVFTATTGAHTKTEQ